MSRPEVFTVGYEGTNLEAFLAQLIAARVTRVIDVRALPLSRKRGYSKTALRELLAQRGIDYVHVRAAGNPYRALKHDPAQCLALYAEHLDREPHVVDQVAEAMQGQRVALLCFERDATHCHRSIIAELLRTRGFVARIRHL